MKRQSQLVILLSIVFCLILSLAVFNCSDDPESGGTSGDGGSGQNGGSETGDGGILLDIFKCERDAQCESDEVCDRDSGKCIKGTKACTEDYNCDYDTEYCDKKGQICKKHQELCQPCEEDLECGKEEDGHKCIEYPAEAKDNKTTVDGGEETPKVKPKFCGRSCGACPKGYYCNAMEGDFPTAQCIPLEKSCTAVTVCLTDADCKDGDVCNMANGACVPKCSFDRKKNDSLGCAVGLVCHKNGKCGKRCLSKSDCQGEFICEDVTGRCRIEGCIDSDECPGNHYCEKSNHTCIEGCEKTEDCMSGYECKADTKKCEQLKCTARGKNISCDLLQFCCGENPNIACTAGVPQGDCFDAPEPYCKTCDPKNADQQTGFSNGQCAGPRNGQDHLCLTVEDESENKHNFCGVGCKDSNDCPRGLPCMEIEVGAEGQKKIIKNCFDPACMQKAKKTTP